MVSKIYQQSMIIGNFFKKNLQKKYEDEVEDWCGTEECATFAEVVIRLVDTTSIGIEDASKFVMNLIESTFVFNADDHGYDDYARGFLAGEVFGIPTAKALKKVEEAEALWNKDNGKKYGYYQDVLNEISRD